MKIKKFLFLSLIMIMAFSAFGFAPMPMDSQAMTHDPFKVSGSSVSSCDMTYTVSEKHSTPKWWNVVDVKGTGQFALTQPHWKVTVTWEFLNSGYTVQRSASGTASQPTGCYTLCDETYDVVGEEIERYPNPADPAEMIIVKELFKYDMYTRDHLCWSGTTESDIPNDAEPYCPVGDRFAPTVWIWKGTEVPEGLEAGECDQWTMIPPPYIQACDYNYIADVPWDEQIHPKDGIIHRIFTSNGDCDEKFEGEVNGEFYGGYWASCMDPRLQRQYWISKDPFSVRYFDYVYSATLNDEGYYFFSAPGNLSPQHVYRGLHDGLWEDLKNDLEWIPFSEQRKLFNPRGGVLGDWDPRILEFLFPPVETK